MQLGEVYNAKDNADYRICISAFASNVDRTDMKIIAEEIIDNETFMVSPSFCLYFNSPEDILKDFDLYMTQEETKKYITKMYG